MAKETRQDHGGTPRRKSQSQVSLPLSDPGAGLPHQSRAAAWLRPNPGPASDLRGLPFPTNPVPPPASALTNPGPARPTSVPIYEAITASSPCWGCSCSAGGRRMNIFRALLSLVWGK